MNRHGEKHLFIVETPFQLFSALSFFEANKEKFDQKDVDIAVYAQFKKASEYVDALESTDVFKSVFLVSPYHERVTREGLTYIGKTLFQKRKSKNRFFAACPFFVESTYDFLYVAGATRFPLDVKQFCAPYAKTVLFEDGVGSRNGAIFKAFSFMDPIEMDEALFSKEDLLKFAAKRFVDKLVKRRLRLNSEELWVFSPDESLRRRFPQLAIHEIPLSCMRSNLVEEVLGSSLSQVENANMIFFASPSTTGGGVTEIQEKIIDLLSRKREWGAIVRRHPRSFDMSLPCELESGNDEACWEMIWGLKGLDEHLILMGFGSTAQITPKILYDEEPYQIFLHRFLPVDSPYKTAAQNAMDELLQRYSEPERIFSPASIEELVAVVEAILNEAL